MNKKLRFLFIQESSLKISQNIQYHQSFSAFLSGLYLRTIPFFLKAYSLTNRSIYAMITDKSVRNPCTLKIDKTNPTLP